MPTMPTQPPQQGTGLLDFLQFWNWMKPKGQKPLDPWEWAFNTSPLADQGGMFSAAQPTQVQKPPTNITAAMLQTPQPGMAGAPGPQQPQGPTWGQLGQGALGMGTEMAKSFAPPDPFAPVDQQVRQVFPQAFEAIGMGAAIPAVKAIGQGGHAADTLFSGGWGLKKKPSDIYYSAVDRFIENSPQARATGPEWLRMLQNQQGIKPTEIEYRGLGELANMGMMTKADLQAFLKERDVIGQLKFHEKFEAEDGSGYTNDADVAAGRPPRFNRYYEHEWDRPFEPDDPPEGADYDFDDDPQRYFGPTDDDVERHARQMWDDDYEYRNERWYEDRTTEDLPEWQSQRMNDFYTFLDGRAPPENENQLVLPGMEGVVGARRTELQGIENQLKDQLTDVWDEMDEPENYGDHVQLNSNRTAENEAKEAEIIHELRQVQTELYGRPLVDQEDVANWLEEWEEANDFKDWDGSYTSSRYEDEAFGDDDYMARELLQQAREYLEDGSTDGIPDTGPYAGMTREEAEEYASQLVAEHEEAMEARRVEYEEEMAAKKAAWEADNANRPPADPNELPKLVDMPRHGSSGRVDVAPGTSGYRESLTTLEGGYKPWMKEHWAEQFEATLDNPGSNAPKTYRVSPFTGARKPVIVEANTEAEAIAQVAREFNPPRSPDDFFADLITGKRWTVTTKDGLTIKVMADNAEEARQTASNFHNANINVNRRGYATPASHYSERDVLAHMRKQDRIMPDGSKALDVQETQSDLVKSGRAGGFARPEGWKGSDFMYVEEKSDPDHGRFHFRHPTNKHKSWTVEGRDKADAADNLAARLVAQGEGGSTPQSPWRTNEDYIAGQIKQLVAEAVDGGYDKIIWTAGETQNQRWGMVQHDVRRIEYDPTERKITAYRDAEGKNYAVSHGIRDEAQLEEYIGAELTEKLLANQVKEDKVYHFYKRQDHDIWDEIGVGALDEMPDGTDVFAEAGATGQSYSATPENIELARKNNTSTGKYVLAGEDAVTVGGRGLNALYNKIWPNTFKKQFKSAKPYQMELHGKLYWVVDLDDAMKKKVGEGLPFFSIAPPAALMGGGMFTGNEKEKRPMAWQEYQSRS